MVPAEGYSIITNLRVDLKSQFNEFLEDDRFKVYAVSEWVINGTCFCNGHGSSCVPLGDETTADGKVSVSITLECCYYPFFCRYILGVCVSTTLPVHTVLSVKLDLTTFHGAKELKKMQMPARVQLRNKPHTYLHGYS